MSKYIAKLFSTFFYIGYLPVIPGTFGSIAGLLIYFFIRSNIVIYALVTLLLIILGFLITGEAEKIFSRKDARCIVIDEVGGILLSFLFIPYDFKIVLIGFLIFRILDAFKPYPADKLQHLQGSLGIMTDDLVAGIYTNLILQFALRLASFSTS